MSDQSEHRCGPYGNAWALFWADGHVQGGSAASTLPLNATPAPRQPAGFRGAAPGASLDDRGRPRVRVKARGEPA